MKLASLVNLQMHVQGPAFTSLSFRDVAAQRPVPEAPMGGMGQSSAVHEDDTSAQTTLCQPHADKHLLQSTANDQALSFSHGADTQQPRHPCELAASAHETNLVQHQPHRVTSANTPAVCNDYTMQQAASSGPLMLDRFRASTQLSPPAKAQKLAEPCTMPHMMNRQQAKGPIPALPAKARERSTGRSSAQEPCITSGNKFQVIPDRQAGTESTETKTNKAQQGVAEDKAGSKPAAAKAKRAGRKAANKPRAGPQPNTTSRKRTRGDPAMGGSARARSKQTVSELEPEDPPVIPISGDEADGRQTARRGSHPPDAHNPGDDETQNGHVMASGAVRRSSRRIAAAPAPDYNQAAGDSHSDVSGTSQQEGAVHQRRRCGRGGARAARDAPEGASSAPDMDACGCSEEGSEDGSEPEAEGIVAGDHDLSADEDASPAQRPG